MRLKFLAISIIAFSSVVSATTIVEDNTVVDLEDTSVEKNIVFEEVSSGRMTYIVDHPVKNLEGQINGSSADCGFEQLYENGGGEIYCPTDSQSFTATLQYDTSGLTQTRNGYQDFMFRQSIYRITKEYNFRVILPEGKGLVEENSYNPEFGEKGSDGGRVTVEWSQNPDLGQIVEFQASYENQERNYLPLVSIIVLLAGLILFIFLYWKSNSDIELPEDQKEVLDLIKANNGGMLQKDIVDESEYSKSKISGVISELEDKGLIDKVKEGRSNRIELKES